VKKEEWRKGLSKGEVGAGWLELPVPRHVRVRFVLLCGERLKRVFARVPVSPIEARHHLLP
jgi:hypothetical protein